MTNHVTQSKCACNDQPCGCTVDGVGKSRQGQRIRRIDANGDDGDVLERRHVRLDIVSLLQQTRALTLEERGFYFASLLSMLNRMEPMPVEDRHAMHIVGCDLREYRRLKRRMISLNKMSEVDGRLTSRLAERETAEYRLEFSRRQQAGFQREKSKRAASAAPAQKTSTDGVDA